MKLWNNPNLMFLRKQKTKKISGVLLFVALFTFSFGHTFLSSPSVALAETESHRDEVPHSANSNDHSPCPTALHQTTSVRHGGSDQQTQSRLGACALVASFDVNHTVGNSTYEFLYNETVIPPDLPLDQRTILLL